MLFPCSCSPVLVVAGRKVDFGISVLAVGKQPPVFSSNMMRSRMMAVAMIQGVANRNGGRLGGSCGEGDDGAWTNPRSLT